MHDTQVGDPAEVAPRKPLRDLRLHLLGAYLEHKAVEPRRPGRVVTQILEIWMRGIIGDIEVGAINVKNLGSG